MVFSFRQAQMTDIDRIRMVLHSAHKQNEKNLGRDFGIPETEIDLVWVLDSTIVHESARGRRICPSVFPKHVWGSH